MGKALARLMFLILVGLVAYLYVQVIALQRENRALSAQVGQVASLRSENAALKARIATGRAPSGTPGRTDWVQVARAHVLNAEQAVGAGDFNRAVRETGDAHLALDRAANEASEQSRQSVSALRAQLDGVQAKARSIWHQFGG